MVLPVFPPTLPLFPNNHRDILLKAIHGSWPGLHDPFRDIPQKYAMTFATVKTSPWVLARQFDVFLVQNYETENVSCFLHPSRGAELSDRLSGVRH